ncbi:DUF6672 family protein [uncultured Fusobacterium sp.]|uniref:DUF6672 family protein n=1 Tax=uncultured Fusobacterium sp. TaxID=159267 RepID=UPI0025D36B98|nr:DUF6672 family protein [uncultured Fusobacterium sp.]
MKMVRNWIILIIVIIGISIALFVTGRLHSVYFENKTKDGYVAINDISYSLNGEKAKKVRINKRGMGEVKGRTHELIVTFKDKAGKKHEIKKTITLGTTENVIIYLPVLVGDGENWIEEFAGK